MSLKVSVIKTSELGAAEVAQWRDIQRSSAHLLDPFLNVEWAQIVAAERADARTAIVEDGGKAVAFLSVQKCDPFTRMGLGSPVADYEGLIARSGVDVPYSLFPKAFGCDRIDFGHLPLELPQNEGIVRVRETVMVSAIDQWDVFVKGLTNKNSSNFRNMGRYRNKMETEKGALEFRSYVKDQEALEKMFEWKSAQYVSTGQPDILARPWIKAVHQRVHDYDGEDFGGVMFTVRAGGEEVLNRRIGDNELAAIKFCLAYVDAQREYAEVDRDGNGVIEYAQKFVSSPGARDGLFWPTRADEPASPLGPLAAQARAEGYGRTKGEEARGKAAKAKGSGPAGPGGGAFRGYRFRILTAQGKDARGGAYDYIVNGRMIGGFALVAWPVRHGASGVMSFQCNHDGVVYEKDLGVRTNELAASMTEYNPDPSWKKSDGQ